MKKLYFYLIAILLACSWQLNAQTVIIDPAGSGGFELGTTFAANGWTVVNGTNTNTWNVGSTPAWFTGTGGAFISNDVGVTWAYTNGDISRSHFYRDITVPSGETNITLSFDWRANGSDGNWDNLQVYICDVAVTPQTTGPVGTNTATTTWTGYTNGTTGYYLTRVNGTTVPTTTSTVNYTLTAAQAAYLAVGTPKRIVFTWKNDGSGGSNPPASVDNISLVSACSPLATAAATAITNNSATLNSATFATATGYNYRYRVVGDPTWIIAAGNPYATNAAPITGLIGSTDYEFQVSAVGPVCNGWSTSRTFTTLCDAFTPNYLEDFSSYLPNCWSEGTGTLAAGPTGTSSGWLQDDFANVTANGKSARVEIWSTGGKEWLISPAFDLSAGGYELNFDVALTTYSGTASAMINPDDTVYLMQSLDGGTTWTELTNWNNSNSPSNTGDNQSIDITALTNSNVKFAFVSIEGTTSGGDFDFFMDNFQVRIPPTCPKPTTLASTNVSSNSVDVSWTTGGANTWIVEYGTTGFTLGAGTEFLVSVAADTTLVGLTPDSDYDVYVRDFCGVGDSSVWVGPISFTTLCAPFVAPYTESFDASISACHSQSATSGGPWVLNSFAWNTSGCNLTPSDNTGNSGRFLTMDFSTPDAGVIFQLNDVDVSALTTPYLEFYHFMCGTGYTPLNELYVEAWDGTAWTLISLINTGSASWEEYGFDLIGYTFGANLVRIRFRAEDGGSASQYFGDMALDDISIIEAPTCPKPTALAIANIGSDTVDLSWTTGGASSWIVEYGAPGFTPGAGTEVVVNVAADTTLVGLTPDSDYDVYVRDFCGVGDSSLWVGPISFTTLVSCPTSSNLSASLVSQTEVELSWDVVSVASSWQIEYGFDGFVQGSVDGTYQTAGTNPFNITSLQADTTYEFYVRDICAAGDTSEWLGPISVLTGYCTPSSTNSDTYIDSFSTSNGVTNISNFQSGYTVGGYQNNYSTMSLSVPASLSFDFRTATVIGNSSTVGHSIWIDWNQNFVFETNERVYTFGSYSSNPFTGTINVPVSTPPGDYTMRVLIDYNAASPTLPCRTNARLEAEDYKLTVLPVPPCVTPSAITSTVLTYDSVQLDWTAGATETEWIVEYNVIGNATVMTTNATATTDTLFNLLADTDYEYRVRSYCGVGDSSAWSNVFTFSTPVSCPAPTALVLNGVSADTASLSWTTGGANAWVVEYGVAGYTPGSGTLVADTFIVLTGLNSATTYDFYVRDFCGTADSSVWINTSFTTLPDYCAGDHFYDTGGSAAVYSANANNTTVICPSNPGDVVYVQFNDFLVEGRGLNNCWDWLRIYDGDDNTATAITPTSLGLGTGTDGFCYETATDGTADLTGVTLYSTHTSGCLTFVFTSDGSGQYDGWDASVTCGPAPTCLFPSALSNNNVSTDTVDLSWTSGGANEWIVEYGPSGYTAGTGTEVLVDTFDYTLTGLNSSTTYDVYVRDYCGVGDSSLWVGPTTFTTIASCLEPINLDASNFILDGATLSWESNGVATEWEVEFDTTGFTPTGVPTLTSIVDTFTNVTGLNSGTDYDFYVRSRCSLTDSSVWSGPYSFTTLPDYCAGDLFVDNGGLTGNYSNNARDTIVICASNPGDIVSVTFNSFNTEANWDGLLIYNGPSVSSPLIPSDHVSTRLTCPTGAWNGTGTNALTGANATQISTDVSGCLTFVFGSDGGGVRAGWDATVTCTPRPANDISVNEVLNLSNSCGVDFTVVELELRNEGAVTQYNVPIVVEVSGDFTQIFNVTVDSILSLETINFVVDSFNTTAGGIANIVAYSNLAGDADLSNDTTSLTVEFFELILEPTAVNVNTCISEDSIELTANLVNGTILTWFDSDTLEIGSSSNLTIQNPGVNSTYYVSATNSISSNVGPVDNTLGTGGTYLTFTDGLVFDAVSDIVIESVEVYAVGAGDVVVNIVNSSGATIYTSTNPVLGVGVETITLNATIPAGVDYEMNAIGSTVTSLYRNTAGAVYPYSNPSVSITGPINALAGYYYFFYNWTVSTAGCSSDLVEVEVSVNPVYNNVVNAIACDEYTYNGNTVTTSGTYTDSLTTVNGCDSVITYNVTINNSSAQTQTITTCTNDTVVVGTNEYFMTGVYVDTLTSALGCDSVVTTDLTINTPTAVSISGLTAEVCLDAGVVNVSASPIGGVLSGNGIVGNNFNPTTAGVGTHTITYTYTDLNVCTSSTSIDVEVLAVCTVGIKDISGIEAINVYPNPFINSINLQFNDSKSGGLTIKLFDMNGKLVVSTITESVTGMNNIEILVPETTASGVHVIQIERDGKTFSKSLLKK